MVGTLATRVGGREATSLVNAKHVGRRVGGDDPELVADVPLLHQALHKRSQQCSPVQRSTVQCSTVQSSTVKRSTVQ